MQEKATESVPGLLVPVRANVLGLPARRTEKCAILRSKPMNQPMPVNPPALRSHLVEASKMAWQPTQFAGIEMKILYSDDEGRSTILFRMAPGAVVPLHEHTALEQTFMLEGSLEDAEGTCGPGDFVWRPGGNIHVAHAPNGATFLAIFNRPNRFFDGTKFFTSKE
jgi:anti-sigma factor ChrR (cupin superfamily)